MGFAFGSLYFNVDDHCMYSLQNAYILNLFMIIVIIAKFI